jgi:hypothetical protein
MVLKVEGREREGSSGCKGRKLQSFFLSGTPVFSYSFTASHGPTIIGEKNGPAGTPTPTATDGVSSFLITVRKPTLDGLGSGFPHKRRAYSLLVEAQWQEHAGSQFGCATAAAVTLKRSNLK